MHYFPMLGLLRQHTNHFFINYFVLMANHTHFLVGVGEIDSAEMQALSLVLAKAYGCDLLLKDCSNHPSYYLVNKQYYI